MSRLVSTVIRTTVPTICRILHFLSHFVLINLQENFSCMPSIFSIRVVEIHIFVWGKNYI